MKNREVDRGNKGKTQKKVDVGITDCALTAKFLADTLTDDSWKEWRAKYYPYYYQFLNGRPEARDFNFFIPETVDYPAADIRLELRMQHPRYRFLFDRWDRDIQAVTGIPPPEGIEKANQ